MKTFAALLFFLFFISFVIVLFVFGISALKKKKNKTAKNLSVAFGVAWVVFLIASLTLGNKPNEQQAIKPDEQKKEVELSGDNYDFMKMELSFFKITGIMITNEKKFLSFIENIDNRNLDNSYDIVKDYRETLTNNERVIDDISIPKEYRDELEETRKEVKDSIVKNYSALGKLLKFLETGSIEKLSEYSEEFRMIEPDINRLKEKLKEIRVGLAIPAPSYQIIFKPEGTKAYYVQTRTQNTNEYFKIIHHITTSVDSNASIVWIYPPDLKLEKGVRPDDSLDPVIEYISATGEINYSDGSKSTNIYDLIR